MLAVGLAMATSAYAENVCARNSTIGHAVLGGMNLSFAGLEAAAAAAAAGDLGAACDAVAAYYRTGNSTAWLRLPPVAAGTALHGGAVDAMVFNDTFGGFPSPPGPVQLTRNEDGGLQWQWWGPDHDDEFMNVMNRHAYFGTLLAAWNATGNGAYARFFGETASDWVLHLPCNRAVAAWANTSSTSTAAAAAVAAASAAAASPCSPFGCTGSAAQCSAGRVCRWEQGAGGPCATGTFESPWRSLEMGIRGSLWPAAFFGFQQAPGFSTDARVLMLLGMAQHVAALLADGGHPGRGTVNWEMQQWSGLLTIAASFPELAGAQAAAAMALEYLSALLESGVYPDGVETEMASGYDMGTAGFYAKALQTAQQAAAVLPGIVPSASFAQRAQAMWDYGAYVVDPRGCLPQNGDSDVCGHGYSAEWADFFNRDDWRYVHSNGAQGTPPSSPAHATPSVMFPWAGQAVLRSSYVRNATWVWFDVGPFGSNPFHAHKDKLQLMLHAHGSILLSDSGRFAYAGTSFSHSLRPYAHETHAHNTLRIDGKQQQQAPALAATPRPNNSWSFAPVRDVVQGSMSLFDGLVGNATHSRTVHHQRGEWLLVVDVVSSDRGSRALQATWHAHPNSTVELGGDGRAVVGGVDFVTKRLTGAQLLVVPATGAVAQDWDSSCVVAGALEGQGGALETQGWASFGYSDAWAAPTLVYDVQLGPGQTRVATAWLMITSPTPFANNSSEFASAVLTAVGDSEVNVTVTVDGQVTHVRVPFESPSPAVDATVPAVVPYDVCTGASAGLPAAECGAWQDIFDGMGGRGWKQCNGKGRADPCACGSLLGMGALCIGGGGSNGSAVVHVSEISLDSNNVSGGLPESLGAFAQLTSLSMYHNQIQGPLPTALRQLTGLQLLALEQNNLTGSIPAWIAELADLQIMDLELNGLSGTLPKSVATMTSLQRIDLLGNPLGGALPELPWQQYTLGCWLNNINFSCPLPPGAAENCTGWDNVNASKNPPSCS